MPQTMTLAEMQRELNDTHDKIGTFWDEADIKYPDAADLPNDLKDEVKALNRRREELENRINDSRQFSQMRDADRARSSASRQPTNPLIVPGPLPTGRNQGQTMQTLADSFLNSSEWRDYWASIAPNGQVSKQTRVQSPAFSFRQSILNLVTGTSDTSGGALVTPDRQPDMVPLGRRPLTLRQLLNVRRTGSDLVEYVRFNSRTNNAAPVAEATASSGSSGVKPESSFDLAIIQEPVKTIANWTPVTRRALADVPQMQGIIETELSDNLEETLETQVLTGDGVGENFTGLKNVSGTQDQAYDTSLLVTTRKARTLVKLNGKTSPNAYLLNSLDWQTIDLLTDNENRYYFGGPSVLGTPRLWGLPVVESDAQTQGAGWVGDWSFATLWDREQGSIYVTDSHLDFFIRNLIAILVEMRAAFGVRKPSAFVEIDLTP